LDHGEGGISQRHLRALFDVGTSVGLTDGQLLERFSSHQGEASDIAFEALVRRHGPMVLRACKGILRDEHEAQDAFQATFLILARKSRSLWVRDSLGPWLHRVACRAATRARSDARRRRTLEQQAADRLAASSSNDDCSRLSAAIHEELDRLPTRYRLPIVLCYLEGHSCEEAARSLGHPVGTIKSQLTRGRKRLQERLKRFNRTATADLLTVLPAESIELLPEILTNTTAQAARRFLADRSATDVAPSSVEVIARGVLTTMVLNRVANVAVGLLVMSLVVAGAAGLGARENGGGPVEVQHKEKDAPARGKLTIGTKSPDSTDLSEARRRDANIEKRSAAVENALAKIVDFHLTAPSLEGREAPLIDFLEYIKSETVSPNMPKGIPVYVDPNELQGAEKTLKSMIVFSLDLDGVPLRTVLTLGLKQLGLEHRVKDGVLVVFGENMEGALTPFTVLLDKSERGELTPEETEELMRMLRARLEAKKLYTELLRLEREASEPLRRARAEAEAADRADREKTSPAPR
jgi:RNA polymerase sigma factor (sigma-70 family)